MASLAKRTESAETRYDFVCFRLNSHVRHTSHTHTHKLSTNRSRHRHTQASHTGQLYNQTRTNQTELNLIMIYYVIFMVV